MSMQIVEEYPFRLCPNSYTWVVRKQLDYLGSDEYMIEIRELTGCVSYGDTFAEAKKGLRESIKIWLKHQRFYVPIVPSSKIKLIYMEPPMTRTEFKQVNYRLLHLLFN
ncbi:type II toxin-antitoxin system HicB family antitoxin [Bacillaceae bacterium IKA-2]|jgi:predicted RNase H-like HicB family nuclease|nr:type II toxin-antitoxin system HicB family antitoxin [Bacillaceae bacterium IKA-2]